MLTWQIWLYTLIYFDFIYRVNVILLNLLQENAKLIDAI